MKHLLLLAALALILVPSGQAQTPAPDVPTTIRFSAVAEEGYPDSKEMTMQGRTVKQTLWVLKDPIITEADILSAKVAPDGNGGNAIVLTLRPSGQSKLNQGIADMLNKQLAIIVNDQLVSAPVLKSNKFGNLVQISGNFTPEQADKIVKDLSH